MKKTILLVTLVFTLSCSFAVAYSQPGIPVAVNAQILLDYPVKVVTFVQSKIEYDGIVIPAGTSLVFRKETKTEIADLPAVNVIFMKGYLPNGRRLVRKGQDPIEVKLVFTGPNYLVGNGKEIKMGSKANAVFMGDITLK